LASDNFTVLLCWGGSYKSKTVPLTPTSLPSVLYVVLLWLFVNCAGIHKIFWFAANAQPDGQRILLWPPLNGFLAERRAKLGGLAYDLDVPNVQKSR